jgi:hypothetical protein
LNAETAINAKALRRQNAEKREVAASLTPDPLHPLE